MKNTFLKIIGTAALVIFMSAMFAQTQVSAQDKVDGQQTENQTEGILFPPAAHERTLEGSWSVETTIRNCQTGVVMESFPKLTTFMHGGTMQESSASLAGFLRTSGHGVWSRGRGRSYSYALQFFRFNANNTYAGLVRARWQVQLDTIGNHYTATSTVEIFNPAGILVANLCGTETATRFE